MNTAIPLTVSAPNNGSDGVLPLLPQHLADLRASGLTDATIRACGFYSVTDPNHIRGILRWSGRANVASLGPCLAIPYFDLSGKRIKDYTRLKPDNPRIETKDNGKQRPRKYENPVGRRGRPSILPYLPPPCLAGICNPGIPLLLTEGEKKAASAAQARFVCVGLPGVELWSIPKTRPRRLRPELTALPWQGRVVFIVYDSDAASKREVQSAERALATALAALGADVRIVRLPERAKD